LFIPIAKRKAGRLISPDGRQVAALLRLALDIGGFGAENAQRFRDWKVSRSDGTSRGSGGRPDDPLSI
jgi:hypothetical protein